MVGLTKRHSEKNEDGSYTIHITPQPAMSKVQKTLRLSERQYLGYLAWENGQLIQDALPDLTADQRELLLTGLDAKEFNAIFPPED